MVKEIIYTKHALERLEMRAISKETIEDAIKNPDEMFKKNEIIIVHKLFGEKMLRVFYRENGNTITVILAYLTYTKRYKGVE